MSLPKINIMTNNVSISETLKTLKGDDGVMNTKEEAKAIHDFYLSCLNKKLNSIDSERLVLANRDAEEFLKYGRNENFWTLLSDAYSGAKRLYAKYFSESNTKKLAQND